MDTYEILEVSRNAREDSQRLYSVSTTIYQTWMILIYIMAAIGGLATLRWLIAAIAAEAADRESGYYFIMSVGVLIITAITCLFNYACAVMSTHISKVLTHISLTNLAILEGQGGTISNSNQVSATSDNTHNSKPTAKPSFKTCSNCRTSVESWAQVCPSCEGENFY
jgi:hypothetical protein